MKRILFILSLLICAGISCSAQSYSFVSKTVQTRDYNSKTKKYSAWETMPGPATAVEIDQGNMAITIYTQPELYIPIINTQKEVKLKNGGIRQKMTGSINGTNIPITVEIYPGGKGSLLLDINHNQMKMSLEQ